MSFRFIRSKWIFQIALSSLIILCGNSVRGESIDGINIKVLSSSYNQTILELQIPEPEIEPVEIQGETYHRLSIPGCRTSSNDGLPELPFISEFIAIDHFGRPDYEILESDERWLPGLRPYPFRDEGGDEPWVDSDVYNGLTVYPPQNITLSRPSVFRDFRVTNLVFYPLCYDPQEGVSYTRRIKLKIFTDGWGENPKLNSRDYISGSFEPIYRTNILNYDILAGGENSRPGRYLMITRDPFNEQVQELFHWKQRMGYDPLLVNLYEEIGGGSQPTSQQIRNYIRNAYNTWEVPPDYVILVGDVEMGTYGNFPDYPYYSYFEGDEFTSDHKYSLLEGDDYLPDVMVGRISVDSPAECATAISKITKYEMSPYMVETDWYKKAACIAANCCATPQPVTPRLVALRNHELFLEHGYTSADTIFCYGYTGCTHTSAEISALFNEGVGVISYRGWGGGLGWTYPTWGVSNILGLSNGWKLPLMTSIVCGSGNYNHPTYDPCFGEAWIRAGTPSSPKGGVAFYGASDPYTHTKWNNPNDEGFYWAFFKYEEYSTVGQCMINAKLNIYKSFPDAVDTTQGVPHYFHVYNILGDPSTMIWTDIPAELAVNHPDTVLIGDNSISVEAQGAIGPLTGALVCLFANDSLQATGLTDRLGYLSLTLNTAYLSPYDSLLLTVTKHNSQPYLGIIRLIEGGRVVQLAGYNLNDDHPGNSDRNISPGEGIDMGILLINRGLTLPEAWVKLFISEPEIVITDSIVEYGDINEGDSTWGHANFSFNVGYDIYQEELRFKVEVHTGPHAIIDTLNLDMRLYSPAISLTELGEPEGDGIFPPGEISFLNLELGNSGSLPAAGLEATLSAEGTIGITILEETASYPTIAPGESLVNTSPFSIQISGEYQEGVVEYLQLFLTGDWYRRELVVPLMIGNPVPTVYTGPDDYGYYCYDNYDAGFHHHVNFHWVEIDTAYGGSGTCLPMAEETNFHIPLPFTFTYYGQNYDTITICENGWLSMGPSSAVDFYNRNIPNPSSAPAQVSVFWDDLSPGGVFYYEDTGNHLFVVEWSRMGGRRDSIQTVEAILYDPAYYPTPTGDGEIKMQYYHVVNNDDVHEYATVGIESPGQEDGLEYTYANFYPYSARELQPGLALIFTTVAPVVAIGEHPPLPPQRAQLLSTFPNPFNSAVSIYAARGSQIEVYNLNGQKVYSREIQPQPSKPVRILWQPRDELTSGIYFVRLKENGQTLETNRLMLLR
ncbi:T9SS type A sorting domain-containing protein [bacterium]|nr:T9SS type A sorting domain-containing protein [bacterium]